MFSAPPLRPSAGVVLALVFLVAGCASTSTSTAPAAGDAATSSGSELPAAEAVPTPLPAATPEPDWLTDAEGKRYFLETYPKAHAHRRVDEKHVRTVWGPTLEIEREDNEFFYYRVYETLPDAHGPSLLPEPPTEEARASYRLDLPKVHDVDFAPFDEGLPRSGQWRNGFAVADLDGDGHLDIAHGAPRKGARGPVVFLGDGKGRWRRWAATFPPFPYDYGDVAAGDLDGDGRLDLVFGIHLKGVLALVQREPAKFSLWNEGLPLHREPQPPGFSSRAVDLIDWDGDGKLDIVALGEGPTLQVARDAGSTAAPAMGMRVFLNLGGGKWREEKIVEGGTGLFGDQLSLADADGDGHTDALVGTNAMGLSGIIVRGSSAAEPRQLSLDPFRPRSYARSVATADFDRDGQLDIAVGFMSHELHEWMTGVDVYLRRKDRGYERRLVYVEQGNRGIWAVDAADVDGDRNPDIVGGTGDGELVVLLGQGGGRFALNPGPELAKAGSCRGYAVRLVDLDDDGKAEVMAEFAGERGGFPGVIESAGCAGEGSLRAWRVTPAD